jgi:hypothetical protein
VDHHHKLLVNRRHSAPAAAIASSFGYLLKPSTGVAGAEDLQIVTDLPEAVLLGDGIGPPLHRRSRHLDGTTTQAADQMMMMLTRRAAAVRRFTVAGPDGIDIACVGHELQGAIDSSQTDPFAVVSQIVVYLLGGSEVMLTEKNLFDRGALPSPPLRTASDGLSAHRSDQHGRRDDDLHG